MNRYITGRHLISDLNAYNIYDYGEMYFRRRHRLFTITSKTMKYRSKKLSSSITVLNEHDNEVALKISELILIYTGDLKKGQKRDPKIRLKLFENCQLSPALIDEGYCQLIRHTTENTNEESDILGWELLAYLASMSHCHHVSPILYPYILNYFVRTSLSGTIRGSFAEYCVKALCLDETVIPINNELDFAEIKYNVVPSHVFGSSLSNGIKLEQKMALYYNHGLLGQFDPLFGAIPKIARNKLLYNIHFSSDAVYNYLVNGGVMTYRFYKQKDETGLIRLSTLLHVLIISVADNSKVIEQIKIKDYLGVSSDSKELWLESTDDEKYRNCTLILLAPNKTDNIQLTTSKYIFKNNRQHCREE